jgi:hypothetical protein
MPSIVKIRIERARDLPVMDRNFNTVSVSVSAESSTGI